MKDNTLKKSKTDSNSLRSSGETHNAHKQCNVFDKKMKRMLNDVFSKNGGVMFISAPPNAGKSWLVMRLAFMLALGTGRDVFGCPHRVLLIDNEHHPETLADRMRQLAKTMGISPDDKRLDNFSVITLRDGEENNPMSCRRFIEAEGNDYDVIIIDDFDNMPISDSEQEIEAEIAAIQGIAWKTAKARNVSFILVHYRNTGRKPSGIEFSVPQCNHEQQ